ncbi:DUF1566 domain-containing protein [Vibrio nigripulchritudo]|uniref:Lcl C-terminal domain-containing protein n=1 Tax=Vibrio nigripulchritudo TaxID=28173 RepID=UPI0003B238A7|nr:DUF1566 domain-containing protein [Vibrio nigripulchritudo]CCN71264.1 exported hypothetical protein [Vibrio nigripulchritudo SFn118]
MNCTQGLTLSLICWSTFSWSDIAPTHPDLVFDHNATAKLDTKQKTQVCKFDSIKATAPDSVFTIDKAKGTVIHKPTGLMYTRCLLGLTGEDCSKGGARFNTWSMAMNVAKESQFAGYSDWRLPNANELVAITEMACHSPALNTNAFPNQFVFKNSGFRQPFVWSSTPSMVAEAPFPKSRGLGIANGMIGTSFRRNTWRFESIHPYFLVRETR